MIADWTVELGPDAPTIDVPWPGWVDLSWSSADEDRPWHPELARALPEVQLYPELEEFLRAANGGDYRTSKVDVFTVDASEVDPELAEAGVKETAFGLGSYLDLLLLDSSLCPDVEACVAFAREFVERIRRGTLPLAAVELVLRPARLYHKHTFGWTLYSMGFGGTEKAARVCWRQAAGAALSAFGFEVALWRERSKARTAPGESSPAGE